MTQKYRRKIALALAGLTLAGCSALSGLGFGDKREPAPASVQVLGQGFTVTGPQGFCVDESATRDTAEGAFVMLASCAALSGNVWDPRPHRPAILTASILPASAPLGEAELDRMTAFFSTEQGQTALVRPGGAGPVTVLDLGREPGLLLVQAQEQTPPAEMAPDYWRGVFAQGNYLVTVTASGFRPSALSAQDGQALLQSFLTSLRAANGGDETARMAQDGGILASIFNYLRN